MSKYGRRNEAVRETERPAEEAARACGAATLFREMLEMVEAVELRLFKAGYRDLSSSVYQSRLRLSDDLRRFEKDAGVTQRQGKAE